MAHLYLQEDPLVSVAAGETDPASTIPTPEQLGSFLVNYAGTGSTGQSGALWVALAIGATSPTIGATAQWVPLGSGGGPGITGGGATLVSGTVSVTLPQLAATSRIQLTMRNPVGPTLGVELTAPDALRTVGASFRVKSATITGVTQADDNSSFDWLVII